MSKKFVAILVAVWSVIIIALIGLLIFLFTTNLSGSNWFHIGESKTYNQSFEKTYAVSDIDKIDVGLASGDIIISQSDSDQIKVEVKNNSNAEITCDQDDSTIEVKQQVQGWSLFNFHFNTYSKVTVTVPASYAKELELKTASGDAKLTGNYTLKDFKYNSASGQFSADSIKADSIDIEAVSGDIKAQRLDGDCSVKTTSGSVKIDAVNGKGTFKTISGGVRANFETVTGNIDASAVSGDVVMTIKEYSNCNINMKSVSGSIDCDYPTTGGKRERNAVIGDGSNSVNINSVSGSVEINK